jgi:hypothetical protein
MSTFVQTPTPTPFGVFDSDTSFQTDADKMVVFVKRKLGDDILSVELTKKQIWANMEESCLEYSNILNQYQAKSTMLTYLGYTTGSQTGLETAFPRESLEYLARFADPYASEAGIGGSYNMYSGSIDLIPGVQDYDLYSELKDGSGQIMFNSASNSSPKTKLRIMEVFHFNPQAAYRFFDTTSAVNYLNNEFSFESFTPETIFYVLPVFEDILRAGQLDLSNRVRRSNYSYKVIGTKIRIFPTPTQIHATPKKLFVNVKFWQNPTNPSFTDETIYGVNNLSNIPFGNLVYARINSMGLQWIRQYTLALSMEQLGMIRNKFSTVPIPGGTVTLNGADLATKGREDKKELLTKLREMLDTLTYDKLIENAATRAENLTKQLLKVPIPNGRAITTG